jgi:hypothetical protein
MTTTPEMGIPECLAVLNEELQDKTEENPGNITDADGIARLTPGEIRRMTALFQPRSLEGDLLDDELHVEVLKGAIGGPEKSRDLDPMLVWWSGRHWYVVDGFHRLLAYRSSGVTRPVPVTVFAGSLAEAVEQAAVCNSKDKKPMTLKDKTNMAWRLTRFFPERSRRQVAEACAIAERSVSNMRAAKHKLEADGVPPRDIPEEWEEARRMWKGIEVQKDFDHDAAMRRKIDRMARALAKTFGATLHRDTDAFAGALSRLDERLPLKLMESREWSPVVERFLEIIGATTPDPDY